MLLCQCNNIYYNSKIIIVDYIFFLCQELCNLILSGIICLILLLFYFTFSGSRKNMAFQAQVFITLLTLFYLKVNIRITFPYHKINIYIYIYQGIISRKIYLLKTMRYYNCLIQVICNTCNFVYFCLFLFVFVLGREHSLDFIYTSVFGF